MITFEVHDMSCGHCVSVLTKALTAVDQDAKLQIDLATRRVHIESAMAGMDELADAIKEAGYTPAPVPPVALPGPGKPAGSCSGCR